MIDAVLLVGLLLASYGAFALLALSQDRHWHHLGGARRCPAPLTALLRGLGGVLLTAALALALIRDGAGFGALLWATAISVCAFAVVCTLTWRPHWLRPLARFLQRLA
jgi:hypothetical protein